VAISFLFFTQCVFSVSRDAASRQLRHEPVGYAHCRTIGSCPHPLSSACGGHAAISLHAAEPAHRRPLCARPASWGSLDTGDLTSRGRSPWRRRAGPTSPPVPDRRGCVPIAVGAPGEGVVDQPVPVRPWSPPAGHVVSGQTASPNNSGPQGRCLPPVPHLL
jgi:hypothetical protein